MIILLVLLPLVAGLTLYYARKRLREIEEAIEDLQEQLDIN